jgi:plasmid stabilization system protein ParE
VAEFQLELLESAYQEILSIVALYKELVGPNSAKRITDKIFGSLELLCFSPKMGREIPDPELQTIGYRMLVIENYIAIYRTIGKTIFVYHIVDGRSNYPHLFASLPTE